MAHPHAHAAAQGMPYLNMAWFRVTAPSLFEEWLFHITREVAYKGNSTIMSLVVL